MSGTPGTAYVLSLIGGIFVLLGGIVLAFAGTIVAAFTFGAGFLLYAFLIFGIIIIIGAVSMNSNPNSTKTWGVVILILGILALFGVITALGGLLAIIGGALGISWKPSTAGPPPSIPRITRVCPQCGRVIAEDTKFCPHCGKQFG